MLNDGEQVTVHLKEKSKAETDEEKDWYEKAFGRKRNMMRVSGIYKPQAEPLKKGRYDVYVRVKYAMFSEMEDEYDSRDFPTDITMKLDGEEDANDNMEYGYDLEYPYGSFEINLLICPKQKAEEEEQ